MRELAVVVVLVAVFAACASAPGRIEAHAALERAEVLVARGDYGSALAAYDEFLGRHPDHPRARSARDTVAQMVAARAEASRLREELFARDRELARTREELAKIRQELQTRQAEAERLRTDLERLKQIDLKPERKRP